MKHSTIEPGLTLLLLALAVPLLTSGPATAAVALPPLAHNSITYGCEWTESIDAKNRNTGYPDTNAQYEAAAMPAYLAPTTGVITIAGKYPHARYFNFASYDGFRPGNLIDGLQDYQMTPRLNGAAVGSPGTAPAPLPDSATLGYDYRISLKYEVPPAPPLARDADVLYMNDGNTHYLGLVFPDVFGAKSVGYRIYLPDAGANDFGDVPLPQITYTAADGTVIDVSNNNPKQSECTSASRAQDALLLVFPQAAVSGTQNTVFDIATGFGVYRVYPNPGSSYARATTNVTYADMVVTRFKRQPTPNVSATPQVRYDSYCQEQYDNTAVVACQSDREFVAQPDGYIVTVVSPLAKRPAKATAANGYNYLPWGPAAEAVIYLRQILANPDFAGNFDHAAGKKGADLVPILGEWAPDASYCDTQTFNAFVDQGGAALLAACKANYKPFTNGVNRADPRN